jgi:hypothetical protein
VQVECGGREGRVRGRAKDPNTMVNNCGENGVPINNHGQWKVETQFGAVAANLGKW